MRTLIIVLASALAGAAVTFLLKPSAPGGCPTDGRMSLKDSTPLLDAYRSVENTHFLVDDTGERLKGWRIDKCKIESIFHQYGDIADGIQLYIGQQADGSHTLLWVASGINSSSNERVDIIEANSANCIVDMTSGCPHDCPPNSPLMR